jgi:hypothetical protein
MNHLETFLRDHAAVHSKAAAQAEFNAEWLFAGLDDRQLRARPHGLNSMAWLVWHLARVEDACVARVVMGKPQLLDAAWTARLGIDYGDSDGEGMTKAQVAELSDAVDLAALREYRDAVCCRTREMAVDLWPDRWSEALAERDVGDMPWLIGKPREELLAWWAVHHSYHHLGQAALVRGVLTSAAS